MSASQRAGGDLVHVRLAMADADPEELETGVRQLMAELRELDDVSAAPATQSARPVGSRAGEVLAIGELLVTLLSSPALPAVLTAIEAWLDRSLHRGDRTIRVQLDGDSLELGRVTHEEADRLITAFVARHDGSSPP